MTAVAVPAMGVQVPRIRSVPAYVSSAGREALECCELAGLHLDPWQAQTLVDSLGERPDGKWAAFEVGVNAARQNGKDAILEGRELTGLFVLGEKRIIHSAHMFDTSLEHFQRLLELIEGCPDFDRRVKKVDRAHGKEGITLRGGQQIRFRTRTKSGGRGFYGDLVVLNEAMVVSEAMLGALMPTMAARSITGNPQLWWVGSSVDQEIHEHGVAFARVRERGVAGGDPSLAYFEWSAEAIDEEGREIGPADVPADVMGSVEAWAQANPGLGIRISAEYVGNELRSMGHGRTFAVERLGIGDWPVTSGAGGVIAIDRWDDLSDGRSVMVDPVCLALDVTPNRSSASIGAAGLRPDGLAHVEVIDRRRGTGWVVDRMVELVARHRPSAVLCDGAGPAASLIDKLEQAGVSVTVVSGPEMARACGNLFDLVDQEGVRHLGTAELREAVKYAKKRPLGDAWAWARSKSTVDISPLVAVTIALSGVGDRKPQSVFASW